jgi:hypothetical protein
VEVAEDAMARPDDRGTFAIDERPEGITIPVEDLLHDVTVGLEVRRGPGAIGRERGVASLDVRMEREAEWLTTLHPTV